jgi:hypothetical protein
LALVYILHNFSFESQTLKLLPMKRFFHFILLLAIPATALHAQVSIDYFGFRSSALPSSYAGWGGGTNVLAAPISLNAKGIFPMNLQLGGGFYMGGAGQKSFEGVFTNAAQDEPMEISFSNSQMSMYGLARFTPSPGKRTTPYIDVFAGFRCSSSSMWTHPEDGTDHEECEFTSLDKSIGFSGGAATGMLIGLSRNVNLDLGVQWHGSTALGKFIDMKSVVNTGDGISYTMKNAPAGMLFIKAGIQFRLTTATYDCCSVRGCKIPSHHTKCGGGHL